MYWDIILLIVGYIGQLFCSEFWVRGPLLSLSWSKKLVYTNKVLGWYRQWKVRLTSQRTKTLGRLYSACLQLLLLLYPCNVTAVRGKSCRRQQFRAKTNLYVHSKFINSPLFSRFLKGLINSKSTAEVNLAAWVPHIEAKRAQLARKDLAPR